MTYGTALRKADDSGHSRVYRIGIKILGLTRINPKVSCKRAGFKHWGSHWDRWKCFYLAINEAPRMFYSAKRTANPGFCEFEGLGNLQNLFTGPPLFEVMCKRVVFARGTLLYVPAYYCICLFICQQGSRRNQRFETNLKKGPIVFALIGQKHTRKRIDFFDWTKTFLK